MAEDELTIGEQLAEWGKVALIETTGRRTGRAVTAAVGFVEEPVEFVEQPSGFVEEPSRPFEKPVDFVERPVGALFVAAGSRNSDWALNLEADPACRVTIGERTARYLADLVDEDDPDRARALTALILKYGTPAERLGNGPVFRLVPA